jgi:hypothetical protein
MKLYRLYIDESGDHTYYKTEDPAKRYLGLTGILIEYEYYRTTFQPELESLKQKHFPHSPDEPVILHREDIINRRGPFWRLREPEKERLFNEDLLQFLSDQIYCIITVVIDKKSHIEQYGDEAYHPYHYCLTALLERYCGYLNFCSSRGDVMAESRGGTEDRLLKRAYKRLYEKGSNQRDEKFFQKALTSCEIKLKPKWKNIAGLQIADTLAHPCKQEILAEKNVCTVPKYNFGMEICRCIISKYNQQVYEGRIWGYGKVFLG